MSSAPGTGLSPNGSPKPKSGEPSALQAAAQRELAASAGGAGAVDAKTGVAVGHVTNYLSLRLDRLLEGCQLRPRVYVFSKLMTTTGVANKAYNNTDHRFEYTWSRGPERQVCANGNCPRANSFSPLEWSKWALQGTRIQCVPCYKLRVPRHRSVFCNVTKNQALRAWWSWRVENRTRRVLDAPEKVRSIARAKMATAHHD